MAAFTMKLRREFRLVVLSVAALVLATPRAAHAYVDPGSGAMLWQLLAAAAIGSLFYARRAAGFIRSHLGLKSGRAVGFVFATCYALIASPLILQIFHAAPMPRFNDIFLVGIVLTTYLFTWESAVYLLCIAALVSAYVLPPYGSLGIRAASDMYRLFSFVATSVFLICLITRLKAQRDALAAAKQNRPAEDSQATAAGQRL